MANRIVVLEPNFPFYRITHINNLPIILKEGLWSMGSGKLDDGYTFIGDRSLTNRRSGIDVPVTPEGTLADYVPCYFGPRSPMLHNIEIGYGEGMVKRPASEIVYLCFRGQVLKANGLEWCYTDGHAKNKLTTFHEAEDVPQYVDSHAIHAKYWGAENVKETDPDMKRRKQAELLIHNHIPPEAILYIFAASETALSSVKQFVLSCGAQDTIRVTCGRS